jgi:hypothetical protein
MQAEVHHFHDMNLHNVSYYGCKLDTPKLWRHSLIWLVAISIVEVHTGDLKIPTRKKWESNLLSSKTLSSCPSGIECGQIDPICCCQIQSKMFSWHQQKLLESWEKNVMSLSVSGSIRTHLCATNSAWKLSNVNCLQVQRKSEPWNIQWWWCSPQRGEN